MTADSGHPLPAFDGELGNVLASIREQIPRFTIEGLPELRESYGRPLDVGLLKGGLLVHEEHVVAGSPHSPEIALSVFKRADHAFRGPALYNIHGGGMVIGNRFSGVEMVLEWVERLDVVAVSVEYRLAPENPDPAPVEDCYSGLVWIHENADLLGIDPHQLFVVGVSAGGGLAAGTALLTRDRKGPSISGQMLIAPMIDDRNETISSQQLDGIGNWDRTSNEFGWDSLLGKRRHTEAASVYAAPSRAIDLSGLPPTFIDVGSAEVFRDEAVSYASTIWASGGSCELHVWPGAFHGSDTIAPFAALSVAAQQARLAWLQRNFRA